MIRLFSVLLFCAFLISPVLAQSVADSMVSESTPALDNPLKNEEPDYPEAYLVEAEKFRLYCQGKPSMSDYYDCGCLAVEYLKRRNDVGPFTHGSSIMSDISGTCQDATGAAGTMYNQCVGKSPSLPEGTDVEAFCSCFGNAYAELFVKMNRKPSSKTSIALHTMAKAKCRAELFPR